ncbi:DUF397 domain-containing protein [Streptomyces jietaisiensis]|uniref:DUF397 domain-containing protein n=1 Tax=Streptomyces griseoaurantiacus TaxID=68213 RepID=A0ABZ1UZJ5_9ACTN|nr:DUF397 domain-containing protein [Streptomyces jietaisiensis]WTI28664.1 DUF397 domain-containing protein [Streptomyces jietaisiensis]
MFIPGSWRKSSYSGEGDGNACLEIASSPTRTAVRDSKDPALPALTFPTASFTAFVDALKDAGPGDPQE